MEMEMEMATVCRFSLIMDHSSITSAKRWVGEWGQKMTIFADLQYYLC